MSLIETIKQLSVEAVNATKPVTVTYGSVLNNNPLQVKLDQKLILSENQLILGSYYASNFTVGEELILLRVQGGKKYFILFKNVLTGGE